MNLVDAMRWRYATKRMTGKQIPESELTTLLETIRLSPSSMGLQPYQIMVISDLETRKRLYPVSYEQAQLLECSHLLVFCAWRTCPPEAISYLINLTAQTRNQTIESLRGYEDMLRSGIDSKGEQFSDWAARQVYLALGVCISACAAMGIDACPMEGFEPEKVDEVLDLAKQNLQSVAYCAIGYRSDVDTFATAAKVRRPMDKIFNRI
ncbi:MAG: NAD(P)H-dependent oxidoreductase [Bacteroidia bacterium]|nr:NAD(P)H-dependent oxidoreductase [Bacteroidia bacterium]